MHETQFKLIDKLNSLHDLGIDVDTRTIYLKSEIDPISEEQFCINMKFLENLSNELPITVELTSPGGDVYSGLAIYDTIVNSPCQVHIQATGLIASMGLIIFLAGDTRDSSENCRFMAHSVSGGTSGKLIEQQIDVRETEYLNNQLIGILADRTKKKKDHWKEELKFKDNFFSRKEAKTLGVIRSK